MLRGRRFVAAWRRGEPLCFGEHRLTRRRRRSAAFAVRRGPRDLAVRCRAAAPGGEESHFCGEGAAIRRRQWRCSALVARRRSAAHGGQAPLLRSGGGSPHVGGSAASLCHSAQHCGPASVSSLIHSFHVFILFFKLYSYNFVPQNRPIARVSKGETFFRIFLNQQFVREQKFCPNGLADKVFVRGQKFCPQFVNCKNSRLNAKRD